MIGVYRNACCIVESKRFKCKDETVTLDKVLAFVQETCAWFLEQGTVNPEFGGIWGKSYRPDIRLRGLSVSIFIFSL